MVLTARYSSVATDAAIAAVRSDAAADVEIPSPATARYAATQAGHLGISASTDAGTTQPIAPPQRRTMLGRPASHGHDACVFMRAPSPATPDGPAALGARPTGRRTACHRTGR